MDFKKSGRKTITGNMFRQILNEICVIKILNDLFL